MDDDDAAELVSYLQRIVQPLMPDGSDVVHVLHLPDRPIEREHLFVVTPPGHLGGLLVGHRGRTADAIRTMIRTFCTARGWGARVDVRIKRPSL